MEPFGLFSFLLFLPLFLFLLPRQGPPPTKIGQGRKATAGRYLVAHPGGALDEGLDHGVLVKQLGPQHSCCSPAVVAVRFRTRTNRTRRGGAGAGGQDQTGPDRKGAGGRTRPGRIPATAPPKPRRKARAKTQHSSGITRVLCTFPPKLPPPAQTKLPTRRP